MLASSRKSGHGQLTNQFWDGYDTALHPPLQGSQARSSGTAPRKDRAAIPSRILAVTGCHDCAFPPALKGAELAQRRGEEQALQKSPATLDVA